MTETVAVFGATRSESSVQLPAVEAQSEFYTVADGNIGYTDGFHRS